MIENTVQVEQYWQAKSEVLVENLYPNHHEPHIVSPGIVRWSYRSIELFWTAANKGYAPGHMVLILYLKYNKRV